MTKKFIKYFVFIGVILLVAWNSIYFRKLDNMRQSNSQKGFNAHQYARVFFNDKLLPRLDSAVEFSSLLRRLKADPAGAFSTYSHALDIGNIKYFLIKGEGQINAIDENEVAITTNDSAKHMFTIATEFVYGNAIRDASGLVSLSSFSSTSDMNSVSEEINKIVRTEVLPVFNAKAKVGDNIQFAGAIELNQAHLKLDSIEVLPIKLTIINQ